MRYSKRSQRGGDVPVEVDIIESLNNSSAFSYRGCYTYMTLRNSFEFSSILVPPGNTAENNVLYISNQINAAVAPIQGSEWWRGKVYAYVNPTDILHENQVVRLYAQLPNFENAAPGTYSDFEKDPSCGTDPSSGQSKARVYEYIGPIIPPAANSPVPSNNGAALTNRGKGFNNGAALANKGKAFNNGAPLANNGAPLANNGAPLANNGAPLANNGAPLANNGAPLANTGAPLANNGAPLANTGAPLANNGAPLANTGAPLDMVQQFLLENPNIGNLFAGITKIGCMPIPVPMADFQIPIDVINTQGLSPDLIQPGSYIGLNFNESTNTLELKAQPPGSYAPENNPLDDIITTLPMTQCSASTYTVYKNIPNGSTPSGGRVSRRAQKKRRSTKKNRKAKRMTRKMRKVRRSTKSRK